MSTLRTLSRQFGGATMAAALFAMPMAACADDGNQIAPATGDNAQITRVAAMTTPAQEQPTTTPVAANTTTQPQVKVPMRDVRGANIGAVQLGAGKTSRDAVVVVFYGTDQAALNEVFSTIRESITNGDPVTGLLVASGAEMIEIFAHGQMIAGEVPPYNNLRNKMLNGIKDGNKYIAKEKALDADQHAALDTGTAILAAN